MGGLGVPELIIVLMLLVPIAAGIWTAVDAGRQPDWAFAEANASKTLWIVMPILGVALCGIVAIIAAIVWATSVRPRVLAAVNQRERVPPPPPPPY